MGFGSFEHTGGRRAAPLAVADPLRAPIGLPFRRARVRVFFVSVVSNHYRNISPLRVARVSERTMSETPLGTADFGFCHGRPQGNDDPRGLRCPRSWRCCSMPRHEIFVLYGLSPSLLFCYWPISFASVLEKM